MSFNVNKWASLIYCSQWITPISQFLQRWNQICQCQTKINHSFTTWVTLMRKKKTKTRMLIPDTHTHTSIPTHRIKSNPPAWFPNEHNSLEEPQLGTNPRRKKKISPSTTPSITCPQQTRSPNDLPAPNFQTRILRLGTNRAAPPPPRKTPSRLRELDQTLALLLSQREREKASPLIRTETRLARKRTAQISSASVAGGGWCWLTGGWVR